MVQRPSFIQPFMLDFTYLFNDALDNPAHTTMGKGKRVRATDVAPLGPMATEGYVKLGKVEERLVLIRSEPMLLQALGK
jgi:hypothetical protein